MSFATYQDSIRCTDCNTPIEQDSLKTVDESCFQDQFSISRTIFQHWQQMQSHWSTPAELYNVFSWCAQINSCSFNFNLLYSWYIVGYHMQQNLVNCRMKSVMGYPFVPVNGAHMLPLRCYAGNAISKLNRCQRNNDIFLISHCSIQSSDLPGE